MGGSKAEMSVNDAEDPSSSSSSDASPSSESLNENPFMNNTAQPCLLPPRNGTQTEGVSAIWNALTTNQDLSLLQYFKQSTKEEHLEMILKNRQEWQWMLSEQSKQNKESISAMLAKREHAKNWKQEQWERNKQSEISKGIRSPGGTKRKVQNFKQMTYGESDKKIRFIWWN